MNQQNQIRKIMNATINTGQYTDRQGNKKNSYLTIGKLFIYSNGGMSLKLDALPLHGQNINFYDIKPKNQTPPPPNNAYRDNSQYQQPPQQQGYNQR